MKCVFLLAILPCLTTTLIVKLMMTLWYGTLFASMALCEGNPPVTSKFATQQASNVEHWSLLFFSWPEQTVEQTVNLRHDAHRKTSWNTWSIKYSMNCLLRIFSLQKMRQTLNYEIAVDFVSGCVKRKYNHGNVLNADNVRKCQFHSLQNVRFSWANSILLTPLLSVFWSNHPPHGQPTK